MKAENVQPGADHDQSRSVRQERASGDAPVHMQQAEWRQWMKDFGRRLRDTRDFLELSQEEVARLAGVSQGAVSRLETAHGLATPLLVVLKVQQALAHHLRQLDPGMLSPELRRTLEFTDFLEAPFAGETQLTGDPGLDELVRFYRDTPERHRQQLLKVVGAAVGGFKSGW